MVVALHILTALFCLAQCVLALFDVRGRFARILMFSALGVVHGLAPVLTPPELSLARFSERSNAHGAALALVGVVLFALGWSALDAWRPRFRGLSPQLEGIIESPQGQALMRRLFWACIIIGVLAWVASVLAGGTGIREVFYMGRFAHRLTGHIYLKTLTQYFLALSIVPGFVCFFLPRRYRPIGIGYAVGMALLLFLASRGSRGTPVGLLGGIVMGYVLRSRLGPRRLAVAGLATLMLALLAVSLYTVRKKMTRQTVPEILANIVSPATYKGAFARDPLNYHQFLVAAVEYFPEQHSFLNGATYRRLFVFFLPRAYFPSVKPEDTNKVFARVVARASGRAATTIPPTMMGDGYINFWGWPGISVMFFNGLLFGYVSYKLRTSAIWFIAIGAPFVRFAMLSIRGQPYEILLVGAWSVFIVWLLGRLFGFSSRRARTVTGSRPEVYA